MPRFGETMSETCAAVPVLLFVCAATIVPIKIVNIEVSVGMVSIDDIVPVEFFKCCNDMSTPLCKGGDRNLRDGYLKTTADKKKEAICMAGCHHK